MPEKIIPVQAFGTNFPAFSPTRSAKLYKKELAQFSLEYDKETGSTFVVSAEPLDLDAQIQTYKDQCGLELAQLQLKRGLKTPADFAADPIDYGDTSTLPDNLNDAFQAAQAAKRSAGSLDLAQFKTDADIQAYVEKAVAAQLAAQEAAKAAKTQPTEGDK